MNKEISHKTMSFIITILMCALLVTCIGIVFLSPKKINAQELECIQKKIYIAPGTFVTRVCDQEKQIICYTIYNAISCLKY